MNRNETMIHQIHYAVDTAIASLRLCSLHHHGWMGIRGEVWGDVEWARRHSVGRMPSDAEQLRDGVRTWGYLKQCASPLAPSLQWTTNDQYCLVSRRVRIIPVKRVYARTFQCLFSFYNFHAANNVKNGWQWSQEKYPHQAWRFFGYRYRILKHQRALRCRNEEDGRRNEQIQIRTHEQRKQQFLQEHN